MVSECDAERCDSHAPLSPRFTPLLVCEQEPQPQSACRQCYCTSASGCWSMLQMHLHIICTHSAQLAKTKVPCCNLLIVLVQAGSVQETWCPSSAYRFYAAPHTSFKIAGIYDKTYPGCEVPWQKLCFQLLFCLGLGQLGFL